MHHEAIIKDGYEFTGVSLEKIEEMNNSNRVWMKNLNESS